MKTKEDFPDHQLQRFYHNKITRQAFEDIFCSYCSKGFNGSAFGCIDCSLFIHERCIHKIPRGKEIRSPFHLEHPLLLQLSGFGGGFCRACNGIYRTTDIVLSCQWCIGENFHIPCCNVTTSGLRLKQYHEKHNLLYVYVVPSNQNRKCVVCNTRCENCHVFGCLACEIFIHLECVPLPRVVKHESHSCDDVVLTLSDLTSRQDLSWDKYNCFF